MIIKCKNCGIEFEGIKIRKYCSRICYNTKRPNVSINGRINQSKSAKLFYKSKNSKKIQIQRIKNISKSNIKKISKNEKIKILKIIDYGYISNLDIIQNKANLKYGYKVIGRFLENNKKYKEIPRFIPKKVQLWDIKKWENFKKDSFKLDHIKMEDKYNLSEKEYKSIVKKFNLYWKKLNKGYIRKRSKIELIIQGFLENLNIDFKIEVYINNQRWRIDFLIEKNKVIEVNGDYWHANPYVYDLEQLNKVQQSNVLRDIEKFKWIKNNSFNLLVLWERDIYMNPKIIIKQIKSYVYK